MIWLTNINITINHQTSNCSMSFAWSVVSILTIAELYFFFLSPIIIRPDLGREEFWARQGGTCGEENYRARMNWVSYSKNYKYLPGGKHHQPLHTDNKTFYLENYSTKQFLQFSKLSVIRQECRNHLISQQKPPNNSKKRNKWGEAPEPEYLLRITSQSARWKGFPFRW